jgi:hypothetical protein
MAALGSSASAFYSTYGGTDPAGTVSIPLQTLTPSGTHQPSTKNSNSFKGHRWLPSVQSFGTEASQLSRTTTRPDSEEVVEIAPINTNQIYVMPGGGGVYARAGNNGYRILDRDTYGKAAAKTDNGQRPTKVVVMPRHVENPRTDEEFFANAHWESMQKRKHNIYPPTDSTDEYKDPCIPISWTNWCRSAGHCIFHPNKKRVGNCLKGTPHFVGGIVSCSCWCATIGGGG